jgi:thymidylate synthase (FAD)
MFKTIHECGVELKAYTMEAGEVLGEELDAGYLPVSAARASFIADDKTGEDTEGDDKLMKYLADHRHVSCFEHNYATMVVECPLFVARQIMRHRSFTFNETSRRYTSEKLEFWIPDKLRKQSKSNKQGSLDAEVDYEVLVWKFIANESMDFYSDALSAGVCREQARALLPQSMLTRFYMTGNLRSWWSFLTSRLKDDTQYETRVIAQKMKDHLDSLWPEAMGVLFPQKDEQSEDTAS